MMRPNIRRDAKHRYYVDDDPTPWPSVTTVISSTTPKDALGWWGQKVACEGIATLASRQVLFQMAQNGLLTPTGLVQALKDHNLTVNHVLNQSAERGARIHGLLEYYAKTGEIIPPSEFPENYRGQIQALASWLLDNDPEFLGQEVMTCSPTFRYAGTLDLRCRIAGKLHIIDLKTGKGIYPSHFIQLVAYDNAEVELGETPADVRAVLHLPEGREAKLVPVPESYEFRDFEVLLEAYNRLQVHKRKKVA